MSGLSVPTDDGGSKVPAGIEGLSADGLSTSGVVLPSGSKAITTRIQPGTGPVVRSGGSLLWGMASYACPICYCYLLVE